MERVHGVNPGDLETKPSGDTAPGRHRGRDRLLRAHRRRDRGSPEAGCYVGPAGVSPEDHVLIPAASPRVPQVAVTLAPGSDDRDDGSGRRGEDLGGEVRIRPRLRGTAVAMDAQVADIETLPAYRGRSPSGEHASQISGSGISAFMDSVPPGNVGLTHQPERRVGNPQQPDLRQLDPRHGDYGRLGRTGPGRGSLGQVASHEVGIGPVDPQYPQAGTGSGDPQYPQTCTGPGDPQYPQTGTWPGDPQYPQARPAEREDDSERRLWLRRWADKLLVAAAYLAGLVSFMACFHLERLPSGPYPMVGNLADWDPSRPQPSWWHPGGAIVVLAMWGVTHLRRLLLIVSTASLLPPRHLKLPAAQPHSTLLEKGTGCLIFAYHVTFGAWLGWANNPHSGYVISDMFFVIPGLTVFLAVEIVTAVGVLYFQCRRQREEDWFRSARLTLDVLGWLGLCLVSMTLPAVLILVARVGTVVFIAKVTERPHCC